MLAQRLALRIRIRGFSGALSLLIYRLELCQARSQNRGPFLGQILLGLAEHFLILIRDSHYTSLAQYNRGITPCLDNRIYLMGVETFIIDDAANLVIDLESSGSGC